MPIIPNGRPVILLSDGVEQATATLTRLLSLLRFGNPARERFA